MYEEELKKVTPDGKVDEVSLIYPFKEVCKFLEKNPESLSWRGQNKPKLNDSAGVSKLAVKYVNGFKKSDFPSQPGTVPDDMVGIVMQVAYGYTEKETKRIKIEHQHSMCAENCVGALLERYLNSVLYKHKWVWCCGDFVKAVDFILPENDGWIALQIKNRDNSENSSSSAIRENTRIQKWFRTYSKTGNTNWDKVPEAMQSKGLSEEGFIKFVRNYLVEKQPNSSEQ